MSWNISPAFPKTSKLIYYLYWNEGYNDNKKQPFSNSQTENLMHSKNFKCIIIMIIRQKLKMIHIFKNKTSFTN